MGKRELDALNLMIDETITFLRTHEPMEGYFEAFSGGKDSILQHKLLDLAGVKYRSYYTCSTIEPPEVIQFIREHYPQVTFLYPAVSFWQMIKEKFPPLRTKRWCCDFMRKAPSRDIPLKRRVMGLRMEESASRAERPRIELHRRGRIIIYKPIFFWAEWMIWEFIERYGLAYPCLYDEGWDRVGCVICPWICSPNMRQVDRNRKRWPGYYRAFEHAVTEWFLAKKARGIELREQTPEEYLHNWYRGGIA